LVVIDDGSDDATAKIVRQHPDPRVKLPSVLRPMLGRVKVRRSMLHSTGYARGHWVNTLTRIPPSFASSTPMGGWKPTSWILCCRGSITQISVEYRSEYALITGVPTYWPACKTSNLCSIPKCFNADAAISAL